jgi:S1-C subfamily serine protease
VNGMAILSGNDIKIAVSDILVGDDIVFDIYREGKKQTISYKAVE